MTTYQQIKNWRKNNPEAFRAIKERYRIKNRSKINQASKQWRDRFPEKQRHSHLKTNYGITIDSYDEMFEKQAGSCAVCNDAPTGKRLHVDHDHATGKIRALLCPRCNLALGCTGDDPGKLRALAEYLEKHQ